MQSEGTPSSGLASSGVLEVEGEGNGYEPLTDGAAERGAFKLVGGYILDGKVQNEVELRAMSGDEEDMLGNGSIPVVMRMNSIMSACTQRIGDIPGSDAAMIQKAIRGMPSGTRTHLLICLRVVSHYKTEKDKYEMEATCPHCKHPVQCHVLLSELEKYDWEAGHASMEYDFTLPYSEVDVTWRVMTSDQDAVVSELSRLNDSISLSVSIAMRLVKFDGEDCALSRDDLLDSRGKKMKLSRRGRHVMDIVRKMQTGDRDALRAQFLDNEPGIETTVTVDCSNDACGREFEVGLDVSQPGFFFPQATSMRSKRKRTT